METSESAPSSDGSAPGMIRAVANALELLQLFSGGRAVQVNQASRTLGLSRSTVHRLLGTLLAYGYVEQDPATRAYLPGPALTGIGLAAVQGGAVSSKARGALERMAAQTHETVHLMVLRGDHVLVLDSIESTHRVRTPSRIGWNLPSQTTAGGKVLLAELDDAEVEAVFPDAMIHGLSRGAPVRRVDLLADLELVRARGYATNYAESEPDLNAIAVALRNAAGHAVAALSVTVPRARGGEDWVRKTGPAAIEVAQEFRDTLA